MNLRLQRRMAAELLKVGENRVFFDADRINEIAEAITREDIRALIKDGAIKAMRVKGNSRGRTRKRHLQRKKGRRRGIGKRKGKATARTPKKRRWINTIRPQRKLLTKLKEKGVIGKKTYRKLYRLAKAGFFRSRAHLKLYLEKMGDISA